MKNKIKLLYLYSEIVGYQIPIFELLVRTYNVNIKVIYWDKKKLKPYSPPTNIEGVEFFKKSLFSREKLEKFSLDYEPDLVYISGWMDWDYLSAVKKIKKNNIPIVTGFDDIWTGSLRQKVGAIFFPIFFKKRYYSHAWVAGPYQFEFAKRIGFKNHEIIFDLLTANTSFFKSSLNSQTDLKFSNGFLYVGNFRKIKGTDILIKAYRKYRDIYNGTWMLTCVGNGDLEAELKKNNDIKVISYSSEEKLKEIASFNSVFILPSLHDQWGVVVHEFVCLGLPLILSNNVGAKASFFIENYNGFSFKTGSVDELCQRMLQFEKLSKIDLIEMKKASKQLSDRINVETSVANLMSLVKK